MIPKEALNRKALALEPYIVPAIVALVGLSAFGLGRLSATPGGEGSLRIIYPDAEAATPLPAAALSANAVQAQAPADQAPRAGDSFGQTQDTYVASRNGAKYYLATCSSAARIKQENRVYFVSKQAAEAAGYEPAANCPGL